MFTQSTETQLKQGEATATEEEPLKRVASREARATEDAPGKDTTKKAAPGEAVTAEDTPRELVLIQAGPGKATATDEPSGKEAPKKEYPWQRYCQEGFSAFI